MTREKIEPNLKKAITDENNASKAEVKGSLHHTLIQCSITLGIGRSIGISMLYAVHKYYMQHDSIYTVQTSK